MRSSANTAADPYGGLPAEVGSVVADVPLQGPSVAVRPSGLPLSPGVSGDLPDPFHEGGRVVVRAVGAVPAQVGVTLSELVMESELSRWQVRRALAALRDLCAEKGWPPVIWTRQSGYHFCAGESELETGERAWISERLTQFRRILTGTLGLHIRPFLSRVMWRREMKSTRRVVAGRCGA